MSTTLAPAHILEINGAHGEALPYIDSIDLISNFRCLGPSGET